MKKKINQIYLWGAGSQAEYVYGRVMKTNNEVIGVVDSDIKKTGKQWKHGLSVYSPEILLSVSFDFILITPRKFQSIQDQCLEMGIPKEKVLVYWKDAETQNVFESRTERIIFLENEISKYRKRSENAPYEYGAKKVPAVKSGEELLKHILEKKCSLSRFGDGEFELMLERPRPWFQKVDAHLAERLKEIIQAEVLDHIVIAIADDFGNLDKYNEENADIIRAYITEDTRDSIMEFIDLNRSYYDAYVTRPYIMYREKGYAKKIFDLFKKVWKDRNVILVEGRYARNGVGNDLFSGVSSVRRILCPKENSWEKYDEILMCVRKNANKDDLICISLGPTATVLAYDLAKEGLQALDIGQLDNEYEWYLRGADRRIDIPGKMVAEINKYVLEEDVNSTSYWEQIIATLE